MVIAGVPVKLHRPTLRDGPDWFSFWSHALGACLASVCTGLMLMKSTTSMNTFACAVYGISMVFLFSCSTAHHAVHRPASHEIQDLFRRLDHISIYFFIAGSYTPLCVLSSGMLDSALPLWMLALVWSMCVAGIAQKTLLPFSSRVATISTYIIMGWASIGLLHPLQFLFPPDKLRFLVIGGVLYTVGACVYAFKRPNLLPDTVGFHGLWHVFVLLAAGSHFYFNYFFVLELPTNQPQA